jgi:acetylornithine deacetylase/succinyl-diaminopimelate desuccinylase-like protein
MKIRLATFFVTGFVVLTSGAPAAQTGPSDLHRLGRDILKELIETDTTHSSGSTTAAAERMAARLLAAGFPRADVVVVGGADRKGNLVARLRGRGTTKPVLFLAHLDVVEAKKEDWSLDPFVLTEKDGHFYGRGTLDVKGGAATLVTAFGALRQKGYVPDRDLILALTADEEGGSDNGVSWLLANRRDLIDAEYCINVDAGGPELHGGKVTAFDVQAAEKIYASFTLTVRNPGGHSSLPVKENAIYRLAAALRRIAALEFPIRTNDVSRGYFAGMAKLASGTRAADLRAVAKEPVDQAAARRLSASSPLYNAMLRTTCVATMLQAGHAENALPQMARATVNCRMLPDDNAESVQQALVRAVADAKVEVAPVATPVSGPASPLAPDVFTALDRAVRATWGAIPLIPFLETGATDGLYLRNAGIPVYGTGAIAYDVDDVRAHGKDERILVRSFYDGIDFIQRLAEAIGGA